MRIIVFMRQQFATIIGKSVKKIAQAKGGGSALPGLVIEKIDADFVPRTLSSLPMGVVLISGTNGKTTTTKIVVELLESQGLRVFTNRTGSNFTRGVAAALLGEINLRGQLSADIAVLELDEAYAVHFVRTIKPRYCLLLNVMRDQLDRFGEIDQTAQLLSIVARSATEAVVLNANDPRLSSSAFRQSITASVHGYAIAPKLTALLPSDDAMRTAGTSTNAPVNIPLQAKLQDITDHSAVIAFGDHDHTVALALRGIYNIQNATGAIALVRTILGDKLNQTAMLNALMRIKPAFGRGEILTVNGQPCELILVKNPAGFRSALLSFNPKGYATMIAINDAYADGRDMSWLWDVDFDSLKSEGVSTISGVRAYDMALRLEYDEVPISTVEPNLTKALRHFISTHSTSPKRIYCSYTAMLSLRRLLADYTTVENIR